MEFIKTTLTGLLIAVLGFGSLAIMLFLLVKFPVVMVIAIFLTLCWALGDIIRGNP